MIPKKLSDWSIEVIQNIITKGYFETISFDFKEMLPPPKDKFKTSLLKSCCAFANQNGGFLIFGIKDNKGLSVEDRIVGIDQGIDFPEQFGNYPLKATPIIEWDFLNPGIDIGKDKKIHIVHIFKSNIGPIGFEEDGRWNFQIRTNKGNVSMTYDEIKNDFVNIYEKRIKLNLLLSEIELIFEVSSKMFIGDNDNSEKYSLQKFNIEIIENVITDIYTILYDNTELIKILNRLRSECKLVNNKINIFWHSVVLPMSNLKQIVKEHNTYINSRLPQIQQLSEVALLLLKKLQVKY